MDASVFVFDAYGTLFDVHSAVARHRDLIGADADRLSALWRTKQLEYTWTRSLMDAYRDFDAITEDALDFAASVCGGITDEARQSLLSAYATLCAYPDVIPALTKLRQSQVRAVILSNGTRDGLVHAMQSAKLTDLLDAPLSVEPLQRYKTVAAAYQLVCDRYGVSPREVSFQSSNRWDIAGAAQFGFRTVWVNRSGAPDEYADLPPERSVSDLLTL